MLRYLSFFSNIRHLSQRSRRTIEMRGINVEAGDASGCAKFDYTPKESCLDVATRCTLVGKDVSPVIGRVMSSAFPTAEKCAVWAELPLQAWCRLR